MAVLSLEENDSQENIYASKCTQDLQVLFTELFYEKIEMRTFPPTSSFHDSYSFNTEVIMNLHESKHFLSVHLNNFSFFVFQDTYFPYEEIKALGG